MSLCIEKMDILPVDFTSVLIPLLVFLLCYNFLRRSKPQLPGPKGLPFIGRPLFFHSNTKRRHEVGVEASKKFGDIFAFKIGPYNFVCVNGFDSIHELFVNRADEFSNRPDWLPSIQRDLVEGKGVIFQSGHPWKVMRRFALRTLRDFGVGRTSIEEKIFQEIDAVSEELQKLNGKASDVQLMTKMMITNVIYGIVFGKRFCYDDSFFQELIHKLDTMFRGPGFITLAAILPKFLVRMIRKTDIDIEKEKQQAADYLRHHIYSEIRQHEESFVSENIRDFVDLYIETARAGKEETEEFNHGNIFRTILDLFLAGSETTSNTVNWCILYLMEKPDVQQKCFQELQEVFGERPVHWEDRGKSIYVEATLMEIQRVANIAPFSLPHSNTAESTINGCSVPKNSIIFANLYSSHVDPKYWDEPEAFRPERFIGDDGKLKQNPAFIPFSIGPRMCMGDSLAKMEMFLIFTNLIQRFEFRREIGQGPHGFKARLDQSTSAPTPYKVCAVKRHS